MTARICAVMELRIMRILREQGVAIMEITPLMDLQQVLSFATLVRYMIAEIKYQPHQIQTVMQQIASRLGQSTATQAQILGWIKFQMAARLQMEQAASQDFALMEFAELHAQDMLWMSVQQMELHIHQFISCVGTMMGMVFCHALQQLI